jgi:hypothetical protein
MTTTKFSINALSDVLERDRRTVTKALRDIEPAGYEGKGAKRSPVWRLKQAIAALAALEPSVPSGDDLAFERALDETEAAFDDAADALAKLPTLAARRAQAPACAALADAYIDALKKRGEAQGLHRQHLELVTEQSRKLMLQALSEPCQWEQVYLEVG